LSVQTLSGVGLYELCSVAVFASANVGSVAVLVADIGCSALVLRGRSRDFCAATGASLRVERVQLDYEARDEQKHRCSPTDFLQSVHQDTMRHRIARELRLAATIQPVTMQWCWRADQQEDRSSGIKYQTPEFMVVHGSPS
jgi:hypothetical protein